MNAEDYILNTDYKAFKNNGSYEYSFTISGTIATGGLSTRTYSFTLPETPDMVDVQFRGRTSGSRPNTSWFTSGHVEVVANGTNWPFFLQARINGKTVTVTATTMNQTSSSYSITTTATVGLRVLDYSIQ